jgi:hypothetical protein
MGWLSFDDGYTEESVWDGIPYDTRCTTTPLWRSAAPRAATTGACLGRWRTGFRMCQNQSGASRNFLSWGSLSITATRSKRFH